MRGIRLLVVNLLLFLFLATCGAAWHHFRWQTVSHGSIARFACDEPAPTCVEGVVVGGIVTRTSDVGSKRYARGRPMSEFRMRLSRIRDGRTWQDCSGICRVVVRDQVPQIRPGNTVHVFGELAAPRRSRNPGEFDFYEASRQRGIHAVMWASDSDSVEPVTSRSNRSYLACFVDRSKTRIRDRAGRSIDRHYDARQAALMRALLLGERTKIDKHTRDRFAQTGTSHLLAISGLHLGILCSPLLIGGRLGLIPWRWTLFGAIGFVWLYCWLVDGHPPVVRASVFISVLCLAKLLYRKPFAGNSISLAALVVLAINPTSLFQPGAQLSFLAVVTLNVLHRSMTFAGERDPLTRLINESRAPHERIMRVAMQRLWHLFLACLTLWAVSVPLVARQFHLITPVAPVANLFVIPVITISLYSGLLVVVIDWWSPALASIVALPGRVALDWSFHAVRIAGTVPGSSVPTAGPSGWWTIGFYLLAAALFVPEKSVLPYRWRWALIALWIGIALLDDGQDVVRRAGLASHSELQVLVVDVGHGTAVIMKLPNDQVVLYDAGALSNDELTGERISQALWHAGVGHLDAVILSHADMDHINGLAELADRLSIGSVYISQSMAVSTDPAWRRLRSKLRSEGIAIVSLIPGDRLSSRTRFRCDKTEFQILHPEVGFQAESDNSASLVLLAMHGHRTILLTGDLEGRGMRSFLASDPENVDVLMAPHHGSGLTPIHEVISHTNPKCVFISGARQRHSELTLARYASQGAYVGATFRDRAIRFRISDDHIIVENWATHDGKSKSRRWHVAAIID